MKKCILNIVTLLSCSLLVASCSMKMNNTASKSITSSIPLSNYEIYYNRIYKFDIVCWEIEKDEWRCGLREKTSLSDLSYFEIIHMQEYAPATLEKMKEIILTYPEYAKAYSIIYEVYYPCPRTWYHCPYDEEKELYLRRALGLPDTRLSMNNVSLVI